MKKLFFILAALISAFISPPLALLLGAIMVCCVGEPFGSRPSKLASTLLKVAVVGLGFGMNLIQSLQSSYEGIVFTVFSVVVVMLSGLMIGRRMGVGKDVSYLIASGTAICGGSAIAAIAPVIKAKPHDTSISLAVIFTLNAVAMLTFPSIGRFLALSEPQFGMWAAIAIHDTSAVVGAAKSYGPEALIIATTIKLSRALWIIPLSLITAYFVSKQGVEAGAARPKINIPWFILFFILAMLFNTLCPLPELVSHGVREASYALLSLTLYLIGTSLSLKNVRAAGLKPVLLGIALWAIISILALAIVMLGS